MAQRLCIVRRDRLDLFEELAREFRETDDVEVIFDRRIGERRKNPGNAADNRRRGERRQYRTDVRLLGWMLTASTSEAPIPLAQSV
jgi:hypothetical protein